MPKPLPNQGPFALLLKPKCEREMHKLFRVLIRFGSNGSKHSVAEMTSDDCNVEVGWLKGPKRS